MEMRQIASFLAVAETLHFGQAAERLHLSQPALSRHVQQLERELGVTLFERRGRRVALTAAGRVLVSHARRLLHEAQEARQAISTVAGNLRGKLSIGCFDGAATYVLPQVLAAFFARHPDVIVSIAWLDSEDALRAVRQGALDAAIVTLPVSSEDVELTPLYREQLLIVLPLGHALGRAYRRRIPLAALRGERLIAWRTVANVRWIIDQALTVAGATVEANIELDGVEAAKNMARAGLGVAIVGEMAVRERAQRTGLVVRPPHPPLSRDVALIRRRGLPFDALVQQFVYTITEVVGAR